MGETISVWYDEEGDYLEVLFAGKKGTSERRTTMP